MDCLDYKTLPALTISGDFPKYNSEHSLKGARMQVDPNSLDPEVRTAKFLALASAALGLMSLCLAIIPVCGGTASIIGILAGLFSLKTENTRTALAGVILSGLGVVVTIVYALFLLFFKK
jgi:hypothetical protein